MKTLDMLGQACPIPVVKAKQSLAEEGSKGVIVLVDNIIAVQNLEKMAKGNACDFSYKEEGSTYRVSIVKSADFKQVSEEPLRVGELMEEKAKSPVVLITSESMGRGAEDLGKILIKGFIFSLTQLNPPPTAVIFLNSGVKLTAEGANTIQDLKTLEGKGVKICTCGTCANYYKTTDTLAVGSIVDMMAIVNQLSKASNIITI